MAERETPDTEVTLGTGKLLGIFLGLAVMCAVFFTLGYMLGRGSASAGKADVVSTAPSSSGNPAVKPSAGNRTSDQNPQPCVAGSANCPQSANTPATSDSNRPPAVQTPAVTPSSNSAKPPDQTVTTKNAPTGTYMVQVAAVSKQEDAESLVTALRKKQYPVFITNTPGDPLFHIQVGPFNDPKEADAMRNRLVNDGYPAIVKK